MLGSLLFLLYINGMEEALLSAGTKFVLYDILVYKLIHSLYDHHLFQSDLTTGLLRIFAERLSA